MPIIACPQCQKKLQLPDSFAGKQVQCPGCKNIFAPAVESEYPPPPSGPPPLPARRDDDRAGGRDDDYDFQERPRRSRYDEDDEPRSRRRGRDDDYDDYDDRRIRRRRLKPHRGSTIQLLGILSIFIAPLILGPIAWVMGASDLREMDEGIMDPSGRQETQTGKTIGMVMTIIGIVAIVGCVLFFCLMSAAAPRGPFR
jgi:hypothetical protein